MVERQPALGGTCLLWGCVRTKALLEHAHAFEVIKGANEWGVMLPFGAPAMDMGQVQTRKDKIVGGLAKGVEYCSTRTRWTGSRAARGSPARGAWTVTSEGGAEDLEAREIIVATGSTPRTIPGVTIDHTRIITSDEAISLRAVPASLVILGSGAVGVEFASIYQRFGSQVTLVELCRAWCRTRTRPFPPSWRSRSGSRASWRTPARRSPAAAAGEKDVPSLSSWPMGSTQAITSDLLLVATGRAPVTEGLGAEDVGLTLDRGYIKVDELYRRRCRTSPRLATWSRWAARARTPSWRTCPRPKGFWWRSGWPGKTSSRSISITSRPARPANPRSAAWA